MNGVYFPFHLSPSCGAYAPQDGMLFVLQSFVFICLALCGYHEYVRFQHAYEITDQQMLEHVRALQTSACAQETVRSVEYKGTVVDCNVLRIIVQRPVYQQAFVLWWHTGVWMDVWKRVVGNTAIVVFLLCVAMYIGFNSVSSYWMTTRMQDMWFKISSSSSKDDPPEAMARVRAIASGEPRALSMTPSAVPTYQPSLNRKVLLHHRN
jgi:hypothetical protein